MCNILIIKYCNCLYLQRYHMCVWVQLFDWQNSRSIQRQVSVVSRFVRCTTTVVVDRMHVQSENDRRRVFSTRTNHNVILINYFSTKDRRSITSVPAARGRLFIIAYYNYNYYYYSKRIALYYYKSCPICSHRTGYRVGTRYYHN